ncbi:IS2 transposase TnpB [Clostridium ragsdalei P11]|uniref:IS2 transposase TnpB n=1 Tax=Clostridium ragsdalei P11 TaxID=1353534 RepID=A0A1A6AKI5_9CLOT|nr:IS3 family transposase [Clostridium ragsdalei]OBR90607.1 IS2 transposase TnpB [Clostridium ragsdalei P11]
MLLNIVGLKSSTYYRWRSLIDQSLKPIKRNEGVIPGFSYMNDKPFKKVYDIYIQKYIKDILNDEYGKFYGYKKITAVLREKYNLKINKKKVYRLMALMGVLKSERKHIKQYKRICKNHEIKASNVLWEMDTKYIYIAETRQVAYLASIIDIFDRSIISCVLSLSPNSESAKEALLKALYSRKIKGKSKNLTIRTDNGSQFIAHDFEKLCINEKITHERIPAKSPNYNAHIESYHRYFQDECLAGKLFKNFEEAEEIIINYVNGYNTKRIHSAIGYRTPDAFYTLKNSSFKDSLVVRL